jgi:DNA-binding response OmpR family regulator
MWWVSLRTTSENFVMAKFIRKKVAVPGEPKLFRTVRGAGYTLKGA